MTDLHQLIDVARPFEPMPARLDGVAPAIVLSVYDGTPEQRHLTGHVQVYFPWLQDLDDQYLIKPWARLCMSAGGRGYPKGERDSDRGHYDREDETNKEKCSKAWGAGLYSPPSVGDEVLCCFEHGDIHHPYVIGTLWNGNDRIPIVTDVTDEFKVKDTVGGPNQTAGPSKHAPITDPGLKDKEKIGKAKGKAQKTGEKSELQETTESLNKLWFWRSRTGHLLLFDDSDTHPKVIITTASGKERVILDEKNHKVQIVSGYFEKKPREPLGGDGALGNQDNGSGDKVDGGDIEILAKNRLWFKARKVNFEVSHNMHIHTGNSYSLFADGKITMQSGGNMSVCCKRAMFVDVKAQYKPAKNAPGAPAGPADPGQMHITTDKKVTMKVKTEELDVKVLTGPIKVQALQDISVTSQTGKMSLQALQEVSIRSLVNQIKGFALAGIDLLGIGPITITSCSRIKATAPVINLN